MNRCPPTISQPAIDSSGSARQPLSPPILALVGASNCGKTTLICRLLAHCRQQGWRVAVIKHTHKTVEPDPPGKDTWRFRQAGAQVVALAGPGILQVTQTMVAEPALDQILAALPRDLDLILVEGYKHSDLPKLVFLTPATSELTKLTQVMAFISDTPVDTALPVFGREQVEALWDFLQQWLTH
jgi:molybdopterin-guanine dinucleotide biosynthesis protein B